jgi:hypothetical protein
MPFQPRYVAKVAKAAKFVNKNKYICESLQAYAPQSPINKGFPSGKPLFKRST